MGKIEEIIKQAGKEVYSILGPDYNEAVYESALAHELRIRGIPYERQRSFEVVYKGYAVGTARTDITVYPKWASEKEEEWLLELKAVKTIGEHHKRQAQVYMVSLNIPHSAVLSFKDDFIMEIVEPPKLEARKVKVVSEIKKENINMAFLEKIASDVFNYFGSYFLYMDDKIKYYQNAIGVELRLRGLEYHSFQKDILYKNMPVTTYGYDMMLEDETVIVVQSYSHKKKETVEEVIKSAIEKEKKFFKLLGIKKGYYIGIPADETEKPVVLEM